MKLQDLTIKQFLEKTASDEAMPAGGSTIALCAALSAAISEMVAKLTLGKAKYTNAEERMREIGIELEKSRLLLMNDIDRDAESFQVVLDAYQLPKVSENEIDVRNREIENALKNATLLQLEVAEKCHALFDLIKEVSNLVEGGLAADGKVSLMICITSAKGAILNVKTNLNQINDIVFKREVIAKCDKIEKDIDNKL